MCIFSMVHFKFFRVLNFDEMCILDTINSVKTTSESLSHPTADRIRPPPVRRPPTNPAGMPLTAVKDTPVGFISRLHAISANPSIAYVLVSQFSNKIGAWNIRLLDWIDLLWFDLQQEQKADAVFSPPVKPSAQPQMTNVKEDPKRGNNEPNRGLHSISIIICSWI